MIGRIGASKALETLNKAQNATKPSTGGIDFKEIFKEALKGDSTLADIEKIQTQLTSGTKFQPEQLLAYQIRAGEFHLKVELASKVAESVSATTRRLQNTQ